MCYDLGRTGTCGNFALDGGGSQCGSGREGGEKQSGYSYIWQGENPRAQVMLLVRVDPGGDFGVEDVEGKGAVGEDFVVEGAEVEFVAELPASLFAEFEDF